MKTGRNSPCPCGCGRKYKVCQAEKRLAAENAARANAARRPRRLASGKLPSLFVAVAVVSAATASNDNVDL